MPSRTSARRIGPSRRIRCTIVAQILHNDRTSLSSTTWDNAASACSATGPAPSRAKRCGPGPASWLATATADSPLAASTSACAAASINPGKQPDRRRIRHHMIILADRILGLTVQIQSTGAPCSTFWLFPARPSPSGTGSRSTSMTLPPSTVPGSRSGSCRLSRTAAASRHPSSPSWTGRCGALTCSTG
jgi:hypothetical protein